MAGAVAGLSQQRRHLGRQEHGVVGYSAIAFFAPAQGNFNPTERTQLLDLARRSLKEGVAPDRSPLADTNNWPAKFREPRGCFVTLTEAGALRGCIGHIFPQESLYRPSRTTPGALRWKIPVSGRCNRGTEPA